MLFLELWASVFEGHHVMCVFEKGKLQVKLLVHFILVKLRFFRKVDFNYEVLHCALEFLIRNCTSFNHIQLTFESKIKFSSKRICEPMCGYVIASAYEVILM